MGSQPLIIGEYGGLSDSARPVFGVVFLKTVRFAATVQPAPAALKSPVLPRVEPVAGVPGSCFEFNRGFWPHCQLEGAARAASYLWHPTF